MGVMKKAKDMANKYDKQVDEGLRKAGEAANRRTGGKYEEKINKGVEQAQRRTGPGSQSR